MKIVRDNRMFVQKKDLTKTMDGSIKYNVGIPNEIIDKVFSDVFVVTSDNMDEYVCFEDKGSFDFINALPFIVDYDQVSALSEEEIIKLLNSTMDEIREVSAKYNSSKVTNGHEYDRTMMSIDLLEHKFYSLREILWEKQGHIQLQYPRELAFAYRMRKLSQNRK